MSNSLLTINQITNEAVRLFTQTNAFLRTVGRQYDDQFARDGAKIGNGFCKPCKLDRVAETLLGVKQNGFAAYVFTSPAREKLFGRRMITWSAPARRSPRKAPMSKTRL